MNTSPVSSVRSLAGAATSAFSRRRYLPSGLSICLAAIMAWAVSQAPAAPLIWDTSTTGGITTGTGTWDFNSTASWSSTTAGSNPLLPWNSNSDTATIIMPTGSATITINGSNGQVGTAGLIFSGAGGANTLNINATGGATLQIGAQGMVSTHSNQVISIAAPLVLTASQTWSSTSARTNSNGAAIRVSGPISTSSGTTNLTFDGRGLFSPTGIANSSNRVSFQLSGANTYTGKTTVTGGATLLLEYGTQNGSKLDDSSVLILAGGSVALNNGTNASEVVASTLLGTGANTIYKGSGGAGTTFNNIQLGAISRNASATFDVTNAVASLAFTTTQNTNGILGGWATVAGGTWAVGSADGTTSTNIIGTSGTDRASSGTWLSTDNVNVTATESGIGSKTVNAIRIRDASESLGFASGATLQVNSGGIIAANTGQSITGGNITSGMASGELFVHTPNAFTIGSSIVDNGGTPTVLVKAGSNTLTLTGTSTYTGGTYVNSGTLAVASGASITGSVVVHGGATFSTVDGFSVASGKVLAGGGSVSGNVSVASGGTIAPGVSFLDDQSATIETTGTLSLGNDLTLNDGAILTFGLGTNSDLLTLTGASAILTGSSSANGLTLNVFDAGGLALQTYTLMQWQSGATLNSFDLGDFQLIGAGGITGSLQFGANSLELVVSAVPEPGVGWMMIAGLGLFSIVRRRPGKAARL